MRKLFVNGKIRTIDKDNHLVTAFAVEDGKFIAVGTEEEAVSYTHLSRRNAERGFSSRL